MSLNLIQPHCSLCQHWAVVISDVRFMPASQISQRGVIIWVQ